jgi:hypothetical protein
MCDEDFARLVSDVLRLHDKGEGRQNQVPDTFTAPSDIRTPRA